MGKLVHDADLAVAVGVDAGVQLVLHGRLGADAADSRVGAFAFDVGAAQAGGSATGHAVAVGAAAVSTIVVGAVLAWQDFFDGCCQFLVVWSGGTFILLMGVGFAASDQTASFSKFIQSLHGQSRDAVVSGSRVMHFMDGDRGVDHFGLDGFLVDDWLYCLMDMVVNVFSCHGWCSVDRVCGVVGD